MHHKRGKAKNRRAGCLLCKPHKMNGYGTDCSHSMTRKEILANEDKKDYIKDPKALDLQWAGEDYGYV